MHHQIRTLSMRSKNRNQMTNKQRVNKMTFNKKKMMKMALRNLGKLPHHSNLQMPRLNNSSNNQVNHFLNLPLPLLHGVLLILSKKQMKKERLKSPLIGHSQSLQPNNKTKRIRMKTRMMDSKILMTPHPPRNIKMRLLNPLSRSVNKKTISLNG